MTKLNNCFVCRNPGSVPSTTWSSKHQWEKTLSTKLRVASKYHAMRTKLRKKANLFWFRCWSQCMARACLSGEHPLLMFCYLKHSTSLCVLYQTLHVSSMDPGMVSGQRKCTSVPSNRKGPAYSFWFLLRSWIGCPFPDFFFCPKCRSWEYFSSPM